MLFEVCTPILNSDWEMRFHLTFLRGWHKCKTWNQIALLKPIKTKIKTRFSLRSTYECKTSSGIDLWHQLFRDRLRNQFQIPPSHRQTGEPDHPIFKPRYLGSRYVGKSKERRNRLGPGIFGYLLWEFFLITEVAKIFGILFQRGKNYVKILTKNVF
jgi:hypothetical protein